MCERNDFYFYSNILLILFKSIIQLACFVTKFFKDSSDKPTALLRLLLTLLETAIINLLFFEIY